MKSSHFSCTECHKNMYPSNWLFRIRRIVAADFNLETLFTLTLLLLLQIKGIRIPKNSHSIWEEICLTFLEWGSGFKLRCNESMCYFPGNRIGWKERASCLWRSKMWPRDWGKHIRGYVTLHYWHHVIIIYHNRSRCRL